MTKEEAVAKATQAIKKRHRRNLPVVGTDYVCPEAVLKRAEQEIEKARSTRTVSESWVSAVRDDAQKFASRIAMKGSYWVVRFDRCPPKGVVIDPAAFIVCVYEATGRTEIDDGP